MKKTVIALLLVIITSAAFSADKDTEFIKKYAEFRYSLFADLEGATAQNLRDFTFIGGEPLRTKILQFLDANKKEITAHRETFLLLHEGKTPDLAAYSPKEGFEAPLKTESFMRPEEKAMTPLLTLISVEPVYTMSMLTTMAISKSERTDDFAAFSIKISIGTPRITAVRSAGPAWTVYCDYYSKLFVYTFNQDTGDCSLDKYLIRRIDKKN